MSLLANLPERMIEQLNARITELEYLLDAKTTANIELQAANFKLAEDLSAARLDARTAWLRVDEAAAVVGMLEDRGEELEQALGVSRCWSKRWKLLAKFYSREGESLWQMVNHSVGAVDPGWKAAIELGRQRLDTAIEILRALVDEHPQDDDYSRCVFCFAGTNEPHKNYCAYDRARKFIEGLAAPPATDEKFGEEQNNDSDSH